MILPTDKQCRDVLDEMENMDLDNGFEVDFVESNSRRLKFTDAQKEVIWNFGRKYQLDSYQPT